MKKLIIITGIMLLAVTAFSQQNSRERTRKKVQDHKSETAVRRTSEKSQQSRTPAHHAERDISRTTSMKANSDRQKTSEVVRNAERKVYTHSNKKPENSKNKTRGNTYVTDKPGKGNHKPSGTVRGKERSTYATPNRRHVRNTHDAGTHYTPVKYKKVHHHYRSPRRTHVTWTPEMYREYRIMYPEFSYWYYPTGYRIVTVPAYNAWFHIGEVRNIYGRIHGAWYSWTTDEYYLYFGGTYPYQDFTVIIEGRDARRFSRHPELFFEGRYIWVTGLVSTFEGKPEIMVRRKSQIHLY